VFVSYFTVYPEDENILNYLENFSNLLLTNSHAEFLLLGKRLEGIATESFPKSIKFYKSIENLVKDI
jgi:hypothetical protein